MITDGCIVECLARLGTLSFFPKDDAGITEIGKILNEQCVDDDEAVMVVNTILPLGWDGSKSIFEARARGMGSMYAPYREPDGESDPVATKKWLDQMDAEFKTRAAARRAKV